jgi:hypothetical protein
LFFGIEMRHSFTENEVKTGSGNTKLIEIY